MGDAMAATEVKPNCFGSIASRDPNKEESDTNLLAVIFILLWGRSINVSMRLRPEQLPLVVSFRVGEFVIGVIVESKISKDYGFGVDWSKFGDSEGEKRPKIMIPMNQTENWWRCVESRGA